MAAIHGKALNVRRTAALSKRCRINDTLNTDRATFLLKSSMLFRRTSQHSQILCEMQPHLEVKELITPYQTLQAEGEKSQMDTVATGIYQVQDH